MNLGFSTVFPGDKKDIGGKPTHFVLKILKGINSWKGYNYLKEYSLSEDHYENLVFELNTTKPKIHTIRTDSKNRWLKGNKIHFVINPRTKQRFQFAPITECTGKERIIIVHPDKSTSKFDPYVIIGEEHIFFGDKRLRELAINDGFDNVYEFFKYFNEYYEGFIIHWTNKRYDLKNIEVTGPETVKCDCKCGKNKSCKK